MCKNFESQIQVWEVELAEKKGRRFQKLQELMGGPVGPEDICSLGLDCIERYISAKHKYNSDKASPKTYMDRISRRALEDFLKKKKAKKRGPFYHTLFLDKAVRQSNGELLTLDETIPETNDRFINRFSKEDLKIDLSKILQKLTETQKELCNLLKRGLNITEISKHLQIPRSTIYDEIKRIRKVFIYEGLKDYLNNF